MQCVLCSFHDDNLTTTAVFVVNGTSVCEDHGIWMMKHVGGDSAVAAHNFRLDVDDLQAWRESGPGYGG